MKPEGRPCSSAHHAPPASHPSPTTPRPPNHHARHAAPSCKQTHAPHHTSSRPATPLVASNLLQQQPGLQANMPGGAIDLYGALGVARGATDVEVRGGPAALLGAA